MIRHALWILAAMAALAIGAGASAATTNQTAVQAQGTEFRISLSRTKIKPGRLRLEFVNYGEDTHDLAIRRVGTSTVRNVGTTLPGKRSVGRYTVKAGTYMLWCTIADHRSRGMRATLKVRR
ncbi:MAG: hypothetical protein QM648_01250 [Solirubrobacterales bacterium]